MDKIRAILDFKLFQLGEHVIRLDSIFIVSAILIVTRVLLWGLKKSLYRKKFLDRIGVGSVYAIYQILKYFIGIIAIGIILESIGIKVTVLIAGSAALLVGVGLGLQQTFNDILSGILLLSERTIKIHDVLEVDNEVVKIEEIGLRTSKCLTRDSISVIIPNSLITTNKVINWSHQSRKTRFKVSVGVAYGSNLELVEKVLIESAAEHSSVTNKPAILALLMDFGSSSIDFEVLFFSEDVFRIEMIKSDIRKTINRKFIEHDIKIPFPQLDLHVKDNPKNTASQI